MIINDSTYYVSEIFESIQGEGNYAGAYSLFIRFHFCNLTCNWCDTKYTWLEKSGTFKKYSESELKSIITESKPNHIIFTGGEPSLYRLDKLVVPNKKFHVETNGSIIPTEELKVELSDKTQISRLAMSAEIINQFNWVVSPKLSNSYQEINATSLQYWASNSLGIFKFIVKTKFDFEELENLISTYNIDKNIVYIGIEGFTLQSQLQGELVDEIIRRGFNFSPRLHVILWGAKRGK